MKQLLSDLLAKATEFLQQLAAKNTGSHSINIEELKRSVSSATLNLRSRIADSESDHEQAEAVVTSVAESVVESVVEAVAPSVAEPVIESVVETVAVVTPVNKPETKAAVVADTEVQLPEDSSLRRHYLTQRRAELIADLGDEPSDSTLKRHYQQLVAAKISD